MKHTPGPWRVTPDGFVSSVAKGYVPIRTPFRSDAFTEGEKRSDTPEETLQANAQLIAAAPSLLAALEMCEIASYRPLVEGELIILRRAIAKARGEEVTR